MDLITLIDHYGLPGAALVALAAFFYFRLWPFLVNEYWPEVKRRELARASLQQQQTEVLSKMEVILMQIGSRLNVIDNRLSDLDVTSKDVARTLLEHRSEALRTMETIDSIEKAVT